MNDSLALNFGDRERAPYRVFNRNGSSRFVIICDHATNHIPSDYADLGLKPHERLMHIAWDPGSLAVGRVMAELLNAPMIQTTTSRLLIDPNRSLDAPDLIPTISETTQIPGNEGVDMAERDRRIAAFHTPYHTAIETLLDTRAARGIESILVAMHSFTPLYKGLQRPWQAGVINGRDERFTRALFDAMCADAPEMTMGWNEPYAAKHGVYYTIDTHADARGLHGTMVEIRNDEILSRFGAIKWAERLTRCLGKTLPALS